MLEAWLINFHCFLLLNLSNFQSELAALCSIPYVRGEFHVLYSYSSCPEGVTEHPAGDICALGCAPFSAPVGVPGLPPQNQHAGG